MVRILVVMGVLSPLLTFAVAAQDGDKEPVLAVPGLLSLPSTNPWSLSQTLLKHATFDTNLPGVPTGGPGTPDFSEQALLGGSTGLDVDALSTGMDWILADDTGRVPPPGVNSWSWAGILLTPGHTPNAGFAQHPTIAAERARVDGAGADLFLYLLAGSILPGTSTPVAAPDVRLVADSIEISLYNGNPSDSTAIDAYDLWAFFYLNPFLQPYLLQPPHAYFSISAATVANIPPTWGIAPQSSSGATIFETTWNGTAWAVPTVFRTPAQLGLAIDNDLDALAVDADPARRAQRGGQIYISFSLDTNVGPNSAPGPGTGLSFSRTGANGRSVRTDHRGEAIDAHIGPGVNVKAICELDPSRDARLAHMVGFGTAPPFLPWTIGITRSVVWRDYDNGVDMLRTHALGGNCISGQSPSHAAFVLATQSPFASIGPLFIAPTQRCGGIGSGQWRGGPARMDIPLPSGIDGTNLGVSFFWADIDATTQAVTLPLPKTMRF